MKRRWVLLLAFSTAAVVSWLVPTQEPGSRGTGRAPAAFEVSRYNDALVYVHLHGGEVEFEAGANLHAETGLAAPGVVHGRVVDHNGDAVSGAIVVGGGGLVAVRDSLRARDGARTDSEGRFSVNAYEDRVSLVAMDHERGMSQALQVPVGGDVELSLEPFTWIEGFIGEGEEPVLAQVTVQTEDMAVTYVGQTDALGRYEIGPIPAGAYQVHARDDDPDTVIAFDVADVELRAGTITTHNVIESDPGSVRVEFVRPSELRVAVVGVTLFEGPEPVHTDHAYEAILRGEVDRANFGTTSLGPANPRKVFRGLPGGSYTACARLNLGDTGMHISCEPVTVGGTDTQEVILELAAG